MRANIKKIYSYLTIVFISFFILLLLSCSKDPQKNENTQKDNELLIYCGITMIGPMLEISKYFEKENNTKINFFYDGSGVLEKLILNNKRGDLFIPGSDIFLENLKKAGFIKNEKVVAYNIAAIIVRKGNPKKINPVLESLANPYYKVILGDEEESSIGRETKSILLKAGLYDSVVKNVTKYAIDSKDITNSIISGATDIGINWKATAYFKENTDHIEAYEIDSKYTTKNPITLTMLSFSKHQDIAKEFIQFASSEKGKEIFKKWGFIVE